MALMRKQPRPSQPEYRVAAFATLDLEKHMAAKPFTIDHPGDIDWHIQNDGDEYVAMGEISIPVTMFFKDDPENETLTIERVVVNGKRKFDARVKIEEEHDPNFGIDVDRAVAENFVRYKDVLGG